VINCGIFPLATLTVILTILMSRYISGVFAMQKTPRPGSYAQTKTHLTEVVDRVGLQRHCLGNDTGTTLIIGKAIAKLD
jgi:hypothetical protein